jgi:hypothetical protein
MFLNFFREIIKYFKKIRRFRIRYSLTKTAWHMKWAKKETRECLCDKDMARAVGTVHSMKQIC